MTEDARERVSPSRTRLDRFEPLFVIGRGGMGSVEAAAERGAAGVRVVALKRLLSHVKDRRHVDMFLREARLAALLDHPNVVHALAYGEHDGELWFAMEYVEGETLASLLERRRTLPPAVAAYLLAELCEGLHAAHELCGVGGAPLGVVHRDVSPHNVMLAYDGAVKLLDFGVAKLESAAHLTKTGEVKGKTAYMSPEQAAGDPLDRRSDLYGVGAILFELVAGRRMWAGETDLDFLRQLALAEPPRLADAAPDAPASLCELHRRLVSKARDERPATALEVAVALRQLAGHSSERVLAAMLAETFGTEAAAKRRRLDEALSRSVREPGAEEPRSGEPGAVIAPATTPRSSRTSPWVYGVVGAALTFGVLLFARRGPAPAVAAVTTASAAPSAVHAAPRAAASSVAQPIATSPPRQSEPPQQVAAPVPSAHRARTPAAAMKEPLEPARPSSSSTAARSRPVIDVDPNPI